MEAVLGVGGCLVCGGWKVVVVEEEAEEEEGVVVMQQDYQSVPHVYAVSRPRNLPHFQLLSPPLPQNSFESYN